MAKRKSQEKKDIIEKCMDDETIIYAFVIPNHLAEKFESRVKKNKQTECGVLVSLVGEWLDNN